MVGADHGDRRTLYRFPSGACDRPRRASATRSSGVESIGLREQRRARHRGALHVVPRAHGRVATVDPRAVAAGDAVLADGGSAADAAIAANAVLAVTMPT